MHQPACGQTFAVTGIKVACTNCGGLLDIKYDWSRLPVPKSLSFFDIAGLRQGDQEGTAGRLDFSGVWRFRELFPFYRNESDVVTIGEGRTTLQTADLLARQMNMKPGKLMLQYEGLNPSGSFKDNGMTAAFTHAKMVGAKKVACASTGNASARPDVFASLRRCRASCSSAAGRSASANSPKPWITATLTLQIKAISTTACDESARSPSIRRNPV